MSMRHLMGFCLLAVASVSLVGCTEEPEAVPAKANVEEVKSGMEEEIEHQNETMEGHGEVEVDPDAQAEVTAGVDE